MTPLNWCRFAPACLSLLLVLLVSPEDCLAQASLGAYQALPALPRGVASAAGVKLSDGRALIVGFDTVGHVFDPASGTFTETGPMNLAHPGARPALLPSGRVLLASGGLNPSDRRAEVYDPATNSWSLTGPVITARKWSGVLSDAAGRVYLLGGEGPGGVLASVERYTEAAGQFTAAGSLTVPHARAVSLVLANGRFLLAGGATTANVLTTSADVYNPATSAATPTGGMAFAHAGGAGVRLLDGRVLITGGTAFVAGGSLRVTTEAELYNPTTGGFTGALPMAVSRTGHTMLVLPSGKVLVTGGLDDWNQCTFISEAYDPSLALPYFFNGPRQPAKFCSHAQVALDDGTALFAGGSGEQLPSGVFEAGSQVMRFNPWLVFADGMGESIAP
jgi:hypothetical protein